MCPPSTAINHHSRSIDIVAGIREQVNSGVSNLFHASKPPGRDALVAGRAVRRFGETLHALGTANGAGGNDVGGHAKRTVLNGDIIGQGIDSGFGGSDMSLKGNTGVMNCCADEDDAAAGAQWVGWI